MTSRTRDRMQTNALKSASGPVEPVYPDYTAPLDREVQPGYIFSARAARLPGTRHYRVGATWIRRGWRGDGCVSRSHVLVKLWEHSIIADDTYAMAA